MTTPLEDIATIIKQAIIDALADRQDELTAIAEAGGAKAGDNIFSDIGDIAKILDLLLNVVAVTNPEFAIPIAIKDAADAAGGKLGRGFGVGYFLGYTILQLATPYINYLTHEIANAAQSELFDPATAATLVAKGVIPIEYGRSEAGGGGLDTPHFNQLADSAETRPDVSTLMTLRNLDAIADADVIKALKRHGYNDFWLEPLQKLRRYLLSPADLALANLRGNIDDATMQGYATQLGITPADMQVLIDNTGEPPGPEQLMEALRRGFIDAARFERGIRQSRVRNEWIDVETALAHSPMTTADAVRAVVENYLTSDEGLAIAQQNGLEPQHWPTLVESWGRPLSHEQMLTLFHRRQATLEQVQQAMRESDIKNKYIEQAIELGRRLIPERTIVSALGHGVITHDAALVALQEQGFTDTDAATLIDLGLAQHKSAHKELSRAELVAMYTDSLLTRADAITHLTGLGYSPADATSMLDLADVKSKSGALKALQRGIEAALKAHHLTTAQATAQLERAGMDHAQAAQLIDVWLTQRGSPTRSLSESQIIALGTHALITPEDARSRLLGLGLVQLDADLLLQLHGIVKV